MGLYHRAKASIAYDIYWSIVDRRVIRDRTREVEFYRRALDGFHPGHLVFDVGAHHGHKTDVFLRLGARVVAVDPDPLNQQVLDQTFRRLRLRPRPVTIVRKAVSGKAGTATFWVDEPGSAKNTLDPKWVETLRRDATRFGRTLAFRDARQVETITLDELIRAHGVPVFVKIDVEGHEPAALSGLSSVVPYVSFEVNLPEFRPEGLRSIALLGRLADGTFNYTADCRQGLALGEWCDQKAFTAVFERCTDPSIEVFWRAPEPKRAALMRTDPQVSLLTGGRDRPYALSLASALISQGLSLDYLGGSDVDGPELHGTPQVTFLEMRVRRQDAALPARVFGAVRDYVRLIGYAATARPPVFHILWNNRLEWFDRTLLMAFYKALGKKVVLTAHNVNAGKRDDNDSWINRLTLRTQYRLSDHIFVHTERMRGELMAGFSVPGRKVSVIPFGINNAVPNTELTTAEARSRLGLSASDKALLFFGNIAPYKGLEYLAAAFAELAAGDRSYRLIIAGKLKRQDGYWAGIQRALTRAEVRDRVVERIEYVPDGQVELYFKAADALILPYTRISQSGVLALGYGFGLPVIASDVGALTEEIVEGRTGFVCAASDAADLARTIRRYFESDLYRGLESHRRRIQEYAGERHSWTTVGAMTAKVYGELAGVSGSASRPARGSHP